MALALLGLLSGCEPSIKNRTEASVAGLQDLYTWDAIKAGVGQGVYEEVIAEWPDVYDSLVNHLTDDTQTKIMEMANIGLIPTVGDVCFQILVRMTNTRVGDYRAQGVETVKGVDNLLFATRFSPGARERLQAHFRQKHRS